MLRAKLLQSHLTLRDPMDCSLPASSVHGMLQARILDWVAMPSSRESSDLEMEPTSLMFPAWAGKFITTSATWEAPTCGSSIQKWKILGEESQDQKVAWSWGIWELGFLPGSLERGTVSPLLDIFLGTPVVKRKSRENHRSKDLGVEDTSGELLGCMYYMKEPMSDVISISEVQEYCSHISSFLVPFLS